MTHERKLPSAEIMARALTDCFGLQSEQLEALSKLHNPMDGIDLSGCINSTIEMQRDITAAILKCAPKNKKDAV